MVYKVMVDRGFWQWYSALPPFQRMLLNMSRSCHPHAFPTEEAEATSKLSLILPALLFRTLASSRPLDYSCICFPNF